MELGVELPGDDHFLFIGNADLQTRMNELLGRVNGVYRVAIVGGLVIGILVVAFLFGFWIFVQRWILCPDPSDGLEAIA